MSTAGEYVAAPALPLTVARDGLRLCVRLQPGASAERIIGLVAEADGGVALKVAVTAPPAEGRANDALLRLLAKTVRLPKRDLSLAHGAADRRKLVHVAGDAAVLRPRLERALAPWLKPA
ncbi:MAG TPA: DUF167 domain-containing protein [Stellaceae bacterium]|nr:DUF167 domain-containing protein [Stellaceae bacterium]